MKIEHIETTLYRIPLATPVEAASHGVMREFDMVAVRLTDSAGGTGCGYTVLNAGHGDAIIPIVKNVFSKTLLADDPRCIERMWARMWRSHHYSGRGGLVSFAIAAVDVALWDLRGRTLGEPLWRLLGGHSQAVRAYAGNIDLNFPLEKLLEGVQHSLDAGYRSIKMRLGKPSLQEDIARVTAVRELIGPDIELMTDANEAWRTDQAMRAFQDQGAVTFDYGNNIRAQAERAGVADAFRIPGFVPEFIRPLFCEGKGPFRWAALSGNPKDIACCMCWATCSVRWRPCSPVPWVPSARSRWRADCRGRKPALSGRIHCADHGAGRRFSRAGSDNLWRNNSVDESCSPRRRARTAGDLSWSARSACSPAGSRAKRRLSGSARFRARTVHGAAATNERWPCNRAGPAWSRNRI